MNKTQIGWTDFTANPIRYRTPEGDSYLQSNGIVVNGSRVVWACEKISAGCANCYAESLSRRYHQRRAGDWNAATMKDLMPFWDPKEAHQMFSKKLSGKRVFIGDMTDVFGSWVDDMLLHQLFAMFGLRPDVTWQLLTKRPERMAAFIADNTSKNGKLITQFPMPNSDIFSGETSPLPMKNVWLGFSAENQQTFDERWPHVAKLAAAGWTTFCSAEPLLAPIDFGKPDISDWPRKPGEQTPLANGKEWDDWKYWAARDRGLKWVIVGLESGPDRRDCGVEPLVQIVGQCKSAGVPAFVKQDCALKPGQQGRITDDIWKLKQFPDEVR